MTYVNTAAFDGLIDTILPLIHLFDGENNTLINSADILRIKK